ncbi:acyltransferase family protein, partial [Microbacterium sp.]|uniref:acyltransferase family protein n=1 Tax=Microbacterium sp. TaxID=51671 RepID=UPI0028980477
MTTPTAPRYAGLDGLRAVAVLLVVLYHLFPGWFLHSGFVGVDVFFVISGFLITSLRLRERAATGRIALRAFWTRRARRLLPALALVVTVSATLAWVVGGDVLVGLGRQVLGAATFSYNWTSIGAGASYFGTAEPELLRNLWSLAVEEQFYVLWPLLLPVLLLVRRRWLRAIVALALATASALWGFAVAGEALTRAYYGTDTHAFGLLIGVALAFALGGERRRATRWARFGMPVAGAAALVALVAVASVPGGAGLYSAIPLAASVLTAVVIATATAPGAMLGRALDVAPLRWIGERSYGIYLWHWPLVVLLTLAATGSFVDTAIPVTAGAAAGVLTLALSALSYRMLEQPVRRLGFAGAGRALVARLRSTPMRRFGAIASLTAGLLVVGGTTAAVAAAPAVSSSEAVVEAGRQALTAASVAPAPPPGEGATGTTPPPDAGATEAAGAGATGTPGPEGVGGTDAAATDGLSVPDAGGRPRPPAPASVDGSRVTAVGDSVMLASAAGLLARLPGVQIDA